MQKQNNLGERNSTNAPQIPWRERPFVSLSVAAELIGISEASVRRMETRGELRFKRIGGRTVVYVDSLIRVVDAEDVWTPSEHGAAARSRRKEIAARAWR